MNFINKYIGYIKLLIVGVIVAVVFNLSQFSFIQNTAFQLNSTLQKISSKIFVLSSSVFRLNELVDENSKLKKENQVLQSQFVNISEKVKEISNIEAQLNFNSQLDFEVIIANTISYSNFINSRSITIDKGLEDDILVNQLVMSAGSLIGVVSSVSNNEAEVQLLSSSNIVISGITEQTRTIGLIEGEISNALSLSQVPIDSELEIGENVLTLGSKTQPRGIIIGEIISISETADKLFRKAGIKYNIDITELETISVLKSK